MSPRLHLHIPDEAEAAATTRRIAAGLNARAEPTTAEIAEAHGHRVVVAWEYLDALTYAVEIAVKRIRRDVLPRTVGPRRDYLASISIDLDAALDRARAALAGPIACPTCATTRSGVRALLTANTDHDAEEPDWHAAIAGARAALEMAP